MATIATMTTIAIMTTTVIRVINATVVNTGTMAILEIHHPPFPTHLLPKTSRLLSFPADPFPPNTPPIHPFPSKPPEMHSPKSLPIQPFHRRTKMATQSFACTRSQNISMLMYESQYKSFIIAGRTPHYQVDKSNRSHHVTVHKNYNLGSSITQQYQNILVSCGYWRSCPSTKLDSSKSAVETHLVRTSKLCWSCSWDKAAW